MSQKKRGLGKGLSDMGLGELLGSSTVAKVEAKQQRSTDSMSVEDLQPGRYQPRQQFNQEHLQELANSIGQQGIVQPLVVRQLSDGKHEIIAGERRWRAAQLAGLQEVPVIVRNDLDDQAAMAVALVENVQRQDLNAIEQSIALQRLITEFDMTHQQAAEVVGKSRTAVTNLLRLLNLNVEVRRMIQQNELEMGHARALLALDGLQQTKVAEQIVRKKLSVRDTETLIRQLQTQASTGTSSKSNKRSPDVLRLERDLSDKLGASVSVLSNRAGKGKLSIKFNSLDELEGILEHIK